MKYYVYVIFRPDGSPCYVGMGQRNRAHSHKYKPANPYLAHIYAQVDGFLPTVKVREDLTQREALDIEQALIKAIGRHPNGPLTNITEGGDLGPVGMVHNAETRIKIGKNSKLLRHSPETRAVMSLARKGKPKTPEHRAKIGRPGRKMSEESKVKMKASAALRWAKPEERQRLSDYHASRTPTEKLERNARVSEGTRKAMENISRGNSQRKQLDPGERVSGDHARW